MKSKYSRSRPSATQLRVNANSKSRRAANKAAGRCLNDSIRLPHHGPPVNGTTKCARCRDVARGLTVVASDQYDEAIDAAVNAALDREQKN